jgi:hypothetical protein
MILNPFLFVSSANRLKSKLSKRTIFQENHSIFPENSPNFPEKTPEKTENRYDFPENHPYFQENHTGFLENDGVFPEKSLFFRKNGPVFWKNLVLNTYSWSTFVGVGDCSKITAFSSLFKNIQNIVGLLPQSFVVDCQGLQLLIAPIAPGVWIQSLSHLMFV